MGWTALFLMILQGHTTGTPSAMRVGNFSGSPAGSLLPENWEPMTFKNIPVHTWYTIVEDNHTPVIKAVSDHSASGLIRKIRIDPEQYPIVKWRWKITNIFQNGDLTKKSGDDFPVRLYIAFEYNPEKATFFERAKWNVIKLIYGEYPPSAAITYIWANKASAGTVAASTYTKSVQMFVVESGDQKVNTWIDEKRNIYKDYIQAFGKEPPMISGIAIMTDSDNTREKTVSYYGDIIMESAKQ